MFHLAGMAEIEILMYLFKGGLPSSVFLCHRVLLLKSYFVVDSFVSKYIISLALKLAWRKLIF